MMKKTIQKWLVLATLIIAGTACEEDAELTTLQQVNFPDPVEASTDNVLLSADNKYTPVVTFSWENVIYPIEAPVTYTIAFDVEADIYGDTAWEGASRITAGEDVLSISLTGEDLNNMAADLGLAPDTEGQLYVRVEAYMDRYVYSAPISISVTPYTEEVASGQLYMPGAYQGWDPATAAVLNAIEPGVFRGFITFSEGTGLDFKFTPEPDWDTSYGYDSNGNFVLSPESTNLTAPGAGSYMIIVNTNTMTFTMTPYSWGIIGTATPGSWDYDTDMTYDYQNFEWVYTGSLVSGAMKFRLNNDWSTNYGNDDGSNGDITDGTMYLDNGGAHTINVAADYKVTFSVDPDNPATATYSVTQL